MDKDRAIQFIVRQIKTVTIGKYKCWPKIFPETITMTHSFLMFSLLNTLVHKFGKIYFNLFFLIFWIVTFILLLKSQSSWWVGLLLQLFLELKFLPTFWCGKFAMSSWTIHWKNAQIYQQVIKKCFIVTKKDISESVFFIYRKQICRTNG